ncbi:MAG: MFS transporter [Amnibacterium sp.]
MILERPARTRTAPELARWRNALFLIFALSGLIFASWVSRVPGVRDLLHASTDEMGLLIFGIAVGSILGLLASSHLIARIGATRTIAWCFSTAAAAIAVIGLVAAFAPGFWAFVLALGVLGAGNSIVDVAMNLSGAANERAIGRTLMPIYHAGWSLGSVAGAGLGALLVLLGVPIGVHFVAVGVLTAIVMLLALRHLRPAEPDAAERPDDVPHGWRGRLAVWGDPRVLLVGVIVLGMAFAEGSANDWLALAMVDGHGVSNSAGAAIFGVFVAAMTVGRMGGVVVLDRFGRVPVLRWSAALAIAGLLLVILVPSVAVAVIGAILWGLGAALGFPVGMSAAADDPHRAAANVSAVATIGYCAFLVGPPVIGLLGQSIGLLPALFAVLVLIVAAGLASGAARHRTA